MLLSIVNTLSLIILIVIITTMSTSTFSPKDFFLWLGAMVALYVSVGSLATLLFNYINILFPDKLQPTYYDPYSGAIRFSIAALVIVFPLFVSLMRLVHQEVRKNKEKSELGVRKWLVYLTVFVAGAFLAGDLIALVNTFLNGEITTRFVLKVAVVLVLAGSILWYYLEELRGMWQKNEALSKMLGGGAALVVLAAIVASFFVIGTPGDARAVRFDQQRVQDLQTLQWHVVEYWQAKDALPSELSDLVDSVRFADVPVDPDSGAQYGYRRVSELTFELCADFARGTDTDTITAVSYPDMYPVGQAGVEGSDWTHGAGEVCFERTIDPAFYATTPEKPLPVR